MIGSLPSGERTEGKGGAENEFKQQYLCGKCDFTYIDGCVELWHTRAEKDLDLTEYLGLTKEEYQIFLAQGNQALKDILDSQRVFRRFCIYQLCLGETQTVPFAFKQLDALRKAGYEQPPAAAYQTVWSAEVCCPKGQNDMEVLGRLFLDYNEHLPEDYRGVRWLHLMWWNWNCKQTHILLCE